jgi:uncharacterized protein
MGLPDLERASQYALGRLQRELPPQLFYHGIAHTRDDVVPAARRLAELEQVDGEDLLLLTTAALYHDLGFIEQYEDNEVISVRIAAESLPDFGYRPAQVDVVSRIIMATRLPQTPQTLPEEIMADADLDVLGRDDFWTKNAALRAELTAFGKQTSDEAWYRSQLRMLQTHRYFTASARMLRDAGKRQHAEETLRRLNDLLRPFSP